MGTVDIHCAGRTLGKGLDITQEVVLARGSSAKRAMLKAQTSEIRVRGQTAMAAIRKSQAAQTR